MSSKKPDGAMTGTNEDGADADVFGLFADRKAEFEMRYPLTSAFMQKAMEVGSKPKKLRIISAAPTGFRRGGISHPAGTAEYGPDHLFTPDQFEQLLADPQFTLELI